MKYKIGIFGSAAGEMTQVVPKAKQLGKVLSRYADKVLLITGACSGLPYAVASEANQNGVEVWGFSPMFDEKGQRQFTPNEDIGIYSQIFYVNRDFQFADNDKVNKKYRNVLSTASCDAGIIISGRWGSMNEFTNLIDMQKVVGVLIGTGGIADELPTLSQKIIKENQGQTIFNNDPENLVKEILEHLSRY